MRVSILLVAMMVLVFAVVGTAEPRYLRARRFFFPKPKRITRVNRVSRGRGRNGGCIDSGLGIVSC